MRTVRQKTLFLNAYFGQSEAAAGKLGGIGTLPTPNTAGNIALTANALPTQELVFTLTAAVISMSAANDFGAIKVCDLPNTKLKILGAVVDLAITVAGCAVNTAEAVDMALGTVTTASTTFANAGEKDLMAKVDGVGATATGTLKGASAAAETDVLIAAGASNDVFLNCSSAVTTGTGTVTVTGTVRLFVVDLGTPAA